MFPTPFKHLLLCMYPFTVVQWTWSEHLLSFVLMSCIKHSQNSSRRSGLKTGWALCAETTTVIHHAADFIRIMQQVTSTNSNTSPEEAVQWKLLHMHIQYILQAPTGTQGQESMLPLKPCDGGICDRLRREKQTVFVSQLHKRAVCCVETQTAQ